MTIRRISEATKDLSVTINELVLPNPIMPAAGTAGLGTEMAGYIDLSRLGAFVTKSLSLWPWAGNSAPRLVPLPHGMLNSVGLHNPGIGHWEHHMYPRLVASGARVVVSIWGFEVDDYYQAAQTVARLAAQANSIVAVEINISCPNTAEAGQPFSHSVTATTAVVTAVHQGLGNASLAVWTKLSPDVDDMVKIAKAAIVAGTDALVLTNTLSEHSYRNIMGQSLVGSGTGGVSGELLRPVAIRAVHECRQAYPDIGIIGVGGIGRVDDVIEYLVAGADAVQIGTATLADPRATIRVLDGLQSWCCQRGMTSLTNLRDSNN